MNLQRLFYATILISITIALLVLAKAIFIPLAFAVLISFLLLPICRVIERKLPRTLAISLVFGFVNILLFGLLFLFFKLFKYVVSDIESVELMVNNFKRVSIEAITKATGINSTEITDSIQNNVGSIVKGPIAFVSEQLMNSTDIFFTLILITIFTFLMLLYRNVFRNFFLSQVLEENRRETNSILNDVQSVSRQYLMGLFIVMGVLGVLNSLGLWIIGVKYSLFWGFFAALLTLIPFVGTFVGGFLPFIFTLVTTGTIWQPIAVVALFFMVQLLEDNFIKPKIVGNQIDLNPFTAIIALLLGGILWGIPGFVLALPYMAILKIVLEHFKETKPLATLLSSEVYDKPLVFKKKYSKKEYSLVHLFRKKEEEKES